MPKQSAGRMDYSIKKKDILGYGLHAEKDASIKMKISSSDTKDI